MCVYPLVPIKCFTYNVSLCFDLIILHPPSLAKDWHITISKVFLYQKYNVRTACTTYVKEKSMYECFIYLYCCNFSQKCFLGNCSSRTKKRLHWDKQIYILKNNLQLYLVLIILNALRNKHSWIHVLGKVGMILLPLLFSMLPRDFSSLFP